MATVTTADDGEDHRGEDRPADLEPGVAVDLGGQVVVVVVLARRNLSDDETSAPPTTRTNTTPATHEHRVEQVVDRRGRSGPAGSRVSCGASSAQRAWRAAAATRPAPGRASEPVGRGGAMRGSVRSPRWAGGGHSAAVGVLLGLVARTRGGPRRCAARRRHRRCHRRGRRGADDQQQRRRPRSSRAWGGTPRACRARGSRRRRPMTTPDAASWRDGEEDPGDAERRRRRCQQAPPTGTSIGYMNRLRICAVDLGVAGGPVGPGLHRPLDEHDAER